MKNQNDLVFSIVAFVILLIAVGVGWGTKPEPVKPTPPEQVNLSDPADPTGGRPVMRTSLAGGGSNGGGGSPAGGAMGGAPMRGAAMGMKGVAANGSKTPGTKGIAG